MSIAPGRIVTQDRDRYRVDGYLMDPDSIPEDTSVPFELEMKCFDLQTWHELPKRGPCLPPPLSAAMCAEQRETLRLWLVDCRAACDNSYCNQNCLKIYYAKMQELNDLCDF